MSKSILVIDTPRACIDCPCHFTDMVKFVPEAGEKFIAVMCGINNRELEADDIETFKPDWCPLKEVLNKKEENKYHNDYERGTIDGFNACIDEILKEIEEN